MKISIRKGVFETNSSSMHALALQKDFIDDCESCKEKYKEHIPNEMDLEILPDAEFYDNIKDGKKLTSIELVKEKINFVYSNIIYRLRINWPRTEPQYNEAVLFEFFEYLNKLGISYKIHSVQNHLDNIFEKYVSIYNGCDDELWEHIFDGSEISFCNFIFGDGSCIDGFETDCGMSEKEENQFWNDLDNHGKCEVYSHYCG